MERDSGLGITGLACGAGLWALSAAALAFAMRQNLDVSQLTPLHSAAGRTAAAHLHGAAVAWALGFTLLQLASFLVCAMVFRAAWRLRTALCYTLSGFLLMAGDCFGLFCLLVWLRLSLGSD
jgi:hypothetical protein